jgi:hypothetical protein
MPDGESSIRGIFSISGVTNRSHHGRAFRDHELFDYSGPGNIEEKALLMVKLGGPRAACTFGDWVGNPEHS